MSVDGAWNGMGVHRAWVYRFNKARVILFLHQLVYVRQFHDSSVESSLVVLAVLL